MVTIVSRAQWGARPPKSRRTIATPTPRLWIHHTAVEWHGPAGVRQTQAFHMDSRGWADIAYSFLVDDDGTIYEGRGAGVAGGHTAGDNPTSHAICALGNLDAREPTEKQVSSIAALARHGRENSWWGDITGGHRDAPGATTACPGRHLYATVPDIRSLARQGDDDMTPEQHAWLGRVHHELVAERASVREFVKQTRAEQAAIHKKLDELLRRQ